MIGNVGMVPVHPYSEIFEDPRLGLNVGVGIFFAFGDEPVNSDCVLNIFLRGEVEALLNHHFNRESVTIVAWLIMDVVAHHSLESYDYILQSLVPARPYMGRVSHKGRTV